MVAKREDDACPISVAPMMEVTTRPFRRMMRLLTKKTWLYTEMIVAGSALHAGDQLLPFDAEEHPITVQLGGSDPEALAQAAVLCEKQGYDAINLNCGCPSERVSAGCFGASLMRRPDHVAEICRRMIESVDIPVAVKCRIGVDDLDSYEHLCEFVSTVSASGVKHFAIHARKALLNGIGTKANRSIPPLRYDVVYRLCEDFPHLKFSINGGITTLEDAQEHLNTSKLCGVMIGRAAYKDPWQFHRADEMFFGEATQEGITRRTIAERYLVYADEEIQLSRVEEWTGGKRLQTQVAEVAPGVTTIRSLDWDRDRFDIEFGLQNGTTYNSYVVRGGDKVALVDVSHEKFRDLYFEALHGVIDPKDIDYVVVNHTEPDHSGLVKDLVEMNPDVTVVGSKVAIMFLKELINKPFNNTVVKGGDELDLGGEHKLEFVMAPNLHWPDTILTFDHKNNLLYTCDVFGMHYCSDKVYDEELNELLPHYRFYYDCLMGPNAKSVLTALKRIRDLPYTTICNGHGPLLRYNVADLVDRYQKWSESIGKAGASVAVLYASDYGYSDRLSQILAKGIAKTGFLLELIVSKE
eukprot:jgi/Pico_ML_1/55761/g1405.t2